MPRLSPLSALFALAVACTADLPAPLPTPSPGASLFQASATVLETGEEGPMLCLGVVLTSDPPAGCAGVPITNWHWGRVTDEEVRGATRWGGYHVFGTFDGRAFTVTELGPPREVRRTSPQTLEPCPDGTSGAGCREMLTQRQLRDVMNRVYPILDELGLVVFTVGTSGACGCVQVEVALAEAEDQAAVDAEHGPGIVRLESLLQPA